MSTYIQWELMLFFQSVCMGVMVLLSYDLLRIFRRIFPHAPAVVAWEDLLYWISLGIFVFAGVYRLNHGNLRSFFALGMLLGAWLCHVTVSKGFVEIGTRILGVPVFFLKISTKRLLFWGKRGKLFLCRRIRLKKAEKKDRVSQTKRGKQSEKHKKKSKQKDNSK